MTISVPKLDRDGYLACFRALNTEGMERHTKPIEDTWDTIYRFLEEHPCSGVFYQQDGVKSSYLSTILSPETGGMEGIRKTTFLHRSGEEPLALSHEHIGAKNRPCPDGVTVTLFAA